MTEESVSAALHKWIVSAKAVREAASTASTKAADRMVGAFKKKNKVPEYPVGAEVWVKVKINKLIIACIPLHLLSYPYHKNNTCHDCQNASAVSKLVNM
jgi:hypothetical protein